eukprot:1161084-Pelagomonas_calceolata.AAC.11
MRWKDYTSKEAMPAWTDYARPSGQHARFLKQTHISGGKGVFAATKSTFIYMPYMVIQHICLVPTSGRSFWASVFSQPLRMARTSFTILMSSKVYLRVCFRGKVVGACVHTHAGRQKVTAALYTAKELCSIDGKVLKKKGTAPAVPRDAGTDADGTI